MTRVYWWLATLAAIGVLIVVLAITLLAIPAQWGGNLLCGVGLLPERCIREQAAHPAGD